jgi:hypothetical protein
MAVEAGERRSRVCARRRRSQRASLHASERKAIPCADVDRCECPTRMRTSRTANEYKLIDTFNTPKLRPSAAVGTRRRSAPASTAARRTIATSGEQCARTSRLRICRAVLRQPMRRLTAGHSEFVVADASMRDPDVTSFVLGSSSRRPYASSSTTPVDVHRSVKTYRAACRTFDTTKTTFHAPRRLLSIESRHSPLRLTESVCRRIPPRGQLVVAPRPI